MFSHQRQSSHLKRSPYHSALMGRTSLQVTHKWNQNISNAIPSSGCLFGFFPPLIGAYIPTGKEEEEERKLVFCTSSFTVFNQHLQNLSPKVIPCTLKEERQFCTVQEYKHRLKIEARPTLQILASTAMSVTNLMDHDLQLCLQRPLQYSYRSKTVTWLIVTLLFSPKKNKLRISSSSKSTVLLAYAPATSRRLCTTARRPGWCTTPAMSC